MASGEYMSVAEARELLGISRPRMTELLARFERGEPGGLAWERNPLDERGKLLKRSDVEALAAKAGKASKNAA
jgi:DNA-binding MarR family transcriptional regulator